MNTKSTQMVNLLKILKQIIYKSNLTCANLRRYKYAYIWHNAVNTLKLYKLYLQHYYRDKTHISLL